MSRSASEALNLSPASQGASRWLGMAGLALCMLMPSLAVSSANVALPAFAQAFGASFQELQWIVLSYLVAVTALVVAAGRLGDLFGRRRVLVAGIACFTVGSLLASFAPSLELLVALRVAQGAGAAVMMALTMALVADVAPPGQTGAAVGFLGTMSAVGTTLGPSMGGMLIASLGWPAIFFINAPLGAVAIALALATLPADRPRQAAARFDAAGSALLALTLGAYALSMTAGGGSFGLVNAVLLLAALAGLGLFVGVQGVVKHPLLPPTMFRDASLNSGLATSALVTTVIMATLVVGPFYLTRSLGLDIASTGLAMSAGPLVSALIGAPAGRLADRLGAQRVIVAGLAAMIVGLLALPLAAGRLGLTGYLAALVVVTAGYALFQAANNTSVMAGALPDQRGVTSAALGLSRNLGLVTGASAMGAVFSLAGHAASTPALAAAAGLQATFLVGALLASLALAIAVVGKRSLPARGA